MNFTNDFMNATVTNDNVTNFEKDAKSNCFVFAFTVPGILWNGILLLCFYRNKNAVWIRDTKNMICNIMSDFVISIVNTLICITWIVPFQQWPLQLCYLRTYLYVTMQCISLNHILALCMDKYCVAVNINHLQRPGLSPYKRSVAIWISASILVAIPYFVPGKELAEYKNACFSNVTALGLSSRSVIIFQTIMTSVPWLITNVLFVVTSVILWRKIRVVQPMLYPVHTEDFTNQIRERNQREKNTITDDTISYISSPNGDTTVGNETDCFDFTLAICPENQVTSSQLPLQKCGTTDGFNNMTSQISDRLECMASLKVFIADSFQRSVSVLTPPSVHSETQEQIKGKTSSWQIQSLERPREVPLSELSETVHSRFVSDFHDCQETSTFSPSCFQASEGILKIPSMKSSETRNAVLKTSEMHFARRSEVVEQVERISTANTTKMDNTPENITKTCRFKSNGTVSKANRENPVTEGNSSKKRRHRSIHVMVTIGLLLMVFNVSMWPVVVGLIGLQLTPPFQLHGGFYVFMFLNQTLNPIIYATRVARLRYAMKELLMSCLNMCK